MKCICSKNFFGVGKFLPQTGTEVISSLLIVIVLVSPVFAVLVIPVLDAILVWSPVFVIALIPFNP